MPKITFMPPGHAPLKYRLDREVVKVGRAADCDAHIAFGGVSNYHAELLQIRSGYMVADSGSTNGIKVDGELVHTADLEHGSTFWIGDIEALFELYPDELETVEAGEDLYPDAPETHDIKPASSGDEAAEGDGDEKEEDVDPFAPPPPPTAPEPPQFDDVDDSDDEDFAPPPPPPPPPPPGFIDEDDEDDEDDEEYDDELGPPPPPPSGGAKVTRSPHSRPQMVKEGGMGMFIFLCILVAIFALGIGLTIRHYKETGRFLFTDLLQRTERVPAD